MTEIEWNKCYYIDCLDEEKGLPYLAKLIENGEMEKIDLGLTDPPYGQKYEQSISPIKNKIIKNYKKIKDSKIKYDDTLFTKEFNLKWLNMALRVCNGVAFTCGTKHHYDWINWKRPDYHEKYWYKSNSVSYILLEPLLFYGKINNFSSLVQMIKIPVASSKKIKTVHPTTKPIKLYEYILSKIQPKSVIDPFLGSGTTAEVCENMDIKWIGYEKEKDYKEDIDMRLSNVLGKSENTLRYYLKK